MANISDLIEEFILSTIGNNSDLELSRRELANHFAVAPSQINYVLNTRFTVERGFVVEGHRGGGGYIKVIRLKDDGDLSDILNELIGNEIGFQQAAHILNRLCDGGYMSEQEENLMLSVITDKSLASPFNYEDKLRANIMKEVLLCLMKNKRR